MTYPRIPPRPPEQYLAIQAAYQVRARPDDPQNILTRIRWSGNRYFEAALHSDSVESAMTQVRLRLQDLARQRGL